ncbi:cytochrome P450 [Mycena floridula]|nr:cytochrome P450 [Mycena floridula]
MLYSTSAFSLVVIFTCWFFWRLYHDVRETKQRIRGIPCCISLLPFDAILTRFIPSPWIAMNQEQLCLGKYDIYTKLGARHSVITVISLFPSVRTGFIVADPGATKTITSSRHEFPKPVRRYTALKRFGSNIISSEGDEWKRFRKITAPAFSDRNNKLVWDETLKIVDEIFAEWEDHNAVVLDHAGSLTLRIALQVIAVAGFGKSIPKGSGTSSNRRMSFDDALQLFSKDIVVLIVSEGLPAIFKRIRQVRTAVAELKLYILEMIAARRQSGGLGERHDLFSGLLNAADDDGALSDSELIGNIFIFLLAGHETTAHTLCYTFALLALYPDEQEALYQHLRSVWPIDRIPGYQDSPLFIRTLAVLYETLRLFPAAGGIPKCSSSDTTLVLDEGNCVIPVADGSDIIVNVMGLHYNPNIWEDPTEFKPSRFLGGWPRDAFMGFSAGPRGCMGRKFSETEAIAVISRLVLQYRITVKPEQQFANESFEQKRARVTDSFIGITPTPIRTPLVFTRRS